MKFENVVQVMADVVNRVRSIKTTITIDGETYYLVPKREFEKLQDLIFADPGEKEDTNEK